MRINGFTLAEILITLLIIGVVAGLVIPNLINDIQDQQFKVAWKKAFAEISQASNLIIAENAGTFKSMCGTHDTSCIVNFFGNYLSTTKICPSNAGGICIKGVLNLAGNVNIDKASTESSGSSAFILSNGYSLLIRWHAGECDFISNNNKCGWMHVDVNGSSGPNRMGKDVFGISVRENKILPYGAKDAFTENIDDCIPTGNGYSCSAKYLYQ